MKLQDYLQKIGKDYLHIKKFKIGKFLAEKYLAISNEKITKILNENIKLYLDGKIEDLAEEVERQILETKLNLISLVSGGGTTMDSLTKKLKNGEKSLVDIVGVIASKSGIGAIDKAEKHKITTEILDNFKAKDPEILNQLVEGFEADIVIGNGWLPLIPAEVIKNFTEKGGIILNQHPGSLRENHLDFGGKGMYGTRVTAARIIYLLETGESGDELFTESTVHTMTEEFDKGYTVGVKKLNIQKEIEEYRNKIKNFENEEKKEELLKKLISDIQTKLLVLEHKNVAETIKNIGKTKTVQEDSRYKNILVPEKNKEILEKAKSLAIKLYPNG